MVTMRSISSFTASEKVIVASAALLAIVILFSLFGFLGKRYTGKVNLPCDKNAKGTSTMR